MTYSGLSIFFGDAEEQLFENSARELVENLIKQNCVYYKIELETTKSNVYGEAKRKTFSEPVELVCSIAAVDDDVYTEAGLLKTAKGDIILGTFDSYLEELEVNPAQGDFIYYNNKYFEIYDADVGKQGLDGYYAGDRSWLRRILAHHVNESVFKGE
jgi:hypothetical protein